MLNTGLSGQSCQGCVLNRSAMKVRLDLALDFEGQHTLVWQPSDATGALDVPRAMLDRWLAEREAFKVASLRWKRVIEEVEEQLYRAERDRLPHATQVAIGATISTPAPPTALPETKVSKSTAIAAQLEHAVVGAGPSRAKRPRRT